VIPKRTRFRAVVQITYYGLHGERESHAVVLERTELPGNRSPHFPLIIEFIETMQEFPTGFG
jgi:hypothetical protein